MNERIGPFIGSRVITAGEGINPNRGPNEAVEELIRKKAEEKAKNPGWNKGRIEAGMEAYYPDTKVVGFVPKEK
jgi:hypothetical protein